MHRAAIPVVLVFALLLAVPALALLEPGQEFPDLRLPAPTEGANYLGVSPGQEFNLSEVRADYLLFNVFSALCPHCQNDAPHMNELFAAIEERGLSPRLKVLGAGVNNTEFEVGLFRTKYKVAFPLTVDEDMQSLQGTGVTGTPTYFLLDLRGQGRPKVLHVHSGRIPGVEEYLHTVLAAAGLEK